MIGTDDLYMVVVIEVHFETTHAFTQRALAQMYSGAIGLNSVLTTDDILARCRCGDGNFHDVTPRCDGTDQSVDRGTVSPHRQAVCMNPTSPSFTIDCDTCVMQHTDACGDCVVSFICSREPGDAIVVDLNEYRALEMLAESGLVPELRHRERSGESGERHRHMS